MADTYQITSVSNVTWGKCPTKNGMSDDMIKCKITKSFDDGRIAQTPVGFKFMQKREDFLAAWENFITEDSNFEAVKKLLEEKEKEWESNNKVFFHESNDWIYGTLTREKILKEREAKNTKEEVETKTSGKKKSSKKNKRGSDKMDIEESPAKIPKTSDDENANEPPEKEPEEEKEEKKKGKKKQSSKKVGKTPILFNRLTDLQKDVTLDDKLLKYAEDELERMKINPTPVETQVEPPKVSEVAPEPMETENSKASISQDKETETPVTETKNKTTEVEMSTEKCDHCGKRNLPVQNGQIDLGSDLSKCAEEGCNKKVHINCNWLGTCKEHTKSPNQVEVTGDTKEKTKKVVVEKMETDKKEKEKDRGSEIIKAPRSPKKKEPPVENIVYSSRPIIGESVRWPEVVKVISRYFPTIVTESDKLDTAKFNDIMKGIQLSKQSTSDKLESLQRVIEEECANAKIVHERNYERGLRSLISKIDTRVALTSAMQVLNNQPDQKYHVSDRTVFPGKLEEIVKENARMRKLLDKLIRSFNEVDKNIKIANEDELLIKCPKTLSEYKTAFCAVGAAVVDGKKLDGTFGAAEIVALLNEERKAHENQVNNLTQKILESTKSVPPASSESDMTDSSSEMSKMKEMLVSKQKELDAATEELEKLRKANELDMTDLDTEVLKMEQALADKQKELDQAKKDMDEVTEELEKLHEKISELESQNAEHVKTGASIAARVEQLEKRYKRVQEEAKETETKFQQSVERNEEMQKKVEEYEQKVKGMADLEKKVVDLETIANDSMMKAAKMEFSYNSLLQTKSEFTRSLEEAKRIAAASLESIGERAKQLKAAQETVSETIGLLSGMATEFCEEMQGISTGINSISTTSNPYGEYQIKPNSEMDPEDPMATAEMEHNDLSHLFYANSQQ